MSIKVLILDTSILCCWINVSNKNTAGTLDDEWTRERVDDLIQKEQNEGSTLVLPIASLIETGNHISQAPINRYECARQLSEILTSAANAQSPWAAFTDQSILWQPDQLKTLATSWPKLAETGLSMGDITIKDVAEYYAKAGYYVQILTGDQGLKAYEPRYPLTIPRRRSC